ncbi:ABC transporter permease [Salisediminibacterium halotolerans]|uniref:ABC transporter permease n=1 Tax=Salisediminibacterium halotolerans TaxID=517425 RepID=UPI000EB2D1D3|nr:ABC transporter permease subunit [Salisediminibacterium halotolerans]RLJ75499.1 ABC-2 type transport system permease protein [Actinophytocola xinjiangensis]RPE89352.1 ABC-2 type transport system permease protein [Salisediminibacterium halotolerans]TWG36112.1 ABC-2 type transport system permease protein [Salisediminibacterium halotolerans]GEL08036.1 putative transmembrane protein YxlG [Salisediminibacterium halotolerans]
MQQWKVLFRKELKESLRNYKWLWIPVVFVLLGITQPLTSYYFADIIEQFGALPEGAIVDIPPPTSAEVLAGTLGQFNQIGLLVLVLAFMGTVAAEKNDGTLIMVLAKPVAHFNYLTAKWVHVLVLAVSSFLLGYAAAVYYTILLIGSISFSQVVISALVYCLWLCFVMTLAVCLSALLNSSGLAAFATLATALILSIASIYAPDLVKGSPGMLTVYSEQYLYAGEPEDGFWLGVIVTAGLIFIMMSAAIYLFKNQEAAKNAG